MHTKGEWIIDTTEKYYKPCVRMNGIIVCYLPEILSNHEPNKYIRAERLSNAQLIAAAPELLEACKEALVMAKHWNKKAEDLLYVELCEKAIAKAEGK